MKISIITVCLNSEQTIEQTIQSVMNQKDSDYEYIIIDGKSTDKTLEIIEKYRSKTLRVISENDSGIYDAMNKGIALASGDIIGIINSDDWYEPGVFEAIRKCFQKTDAEAIYGRMNLIYENGKVGFLVPSDIEKIRYEMEIPHPTVFIKKEIYKKYGGFQLKYKIAADYDLMLRLYTKGVKFEYIDRVLANFRMSGISVQQEEVCGKETLMIAQQYLPYASLGSRKYFKDIIAHRWKAYIFEKLVNHFPQEFYDILNKKLGVGSYDDIAIFGAGKWGISVYNLLWQKNITPLFIVDNSIKKQGKLKDGIQILGPETLRFFKGVLLIMVKEFSPEILLQVGKINSSELYCIAWEEIADEFAWGTNIYE